MSFSPKSVCRKNQPASCWPWAVAFALLAPCRPLSVAGASAPEETLQPVKRDPTHRGASPGTSLEWWYLTGPLWNGHACNDETGLLVEPQAKPGAQVVIDPQWGVQITYFHASKGPRQGLLFHGALSDLEKQEHEIWKLAEPWADGRLSGLLGSADPSELDLRMGAQFLSRGSVGPSGIESLWWARLTTARYDLRLTLEVPEAKLWKHGKEGRVEKLPGQSNGYVSYPFLRATGLLRDKTSGRWSPVCGSLWFDHEVDVGLVENLSWSWFSVRFANGKAYMFYELWAEDSGPRRPLATFGEAFSLADVNSAALTKVRIEPGQSVCLRSGSCYSQRFQIRFEEGGVERVFEVESAFPEQEIVDPSVRSYWEGLARVRDEEGNKGLAFVELTKQEKKPQIP